MAEPSDEQIAALVQKGDLESFGGLVERYEAKMTRYARKFLFNHHDGEDLAQEVFIKAFINIQSFDSKRKFSSWLYRIAHNEFINAIRKKKNEPLPFFDADTLLPHPSAREDPAKEAENNNLKEILDKSLAKIDAKYREPLVLFYFEELSYQEIAEILHIPVSTVGVRLARGKKFLKKAYNQYGNFTNH